MKMLEAIPTPNDALPGAGALHSFWNFSLDEFSDFMKCAGHPAYRAKQIWQWVYRKRAKSFSDMTDLPLSLRAELENRIDLTSPSVVARNVDPSDGAEKVLLEYLDGERVEAVRMKRYKRPVKTDSRTGEVRDADPAGSDGFTACLSTQVGCQFACRFCASGQSGLKRNLTAGEIVSQLAAFLREGKEINRIVFMGSGEPLHNFDGLRRAIDILSCKDGLGMSPRRMTVSTVGLPPEIYRMAQEDWKTKLAISLHATTDAARVQLIPLARVFQLDQLMDALRFYQRSQGRRITFEYLMIDGVNDAPEDAGRLKTLTQGLTCHINLIPFNRIPRTSFQPSSPHRIQAFRTRLRKHGLDATVRYSRGRNIDAACGQLRLRYEESLESVDS